jgi:hypothetical protein
MAVTLTHNAPITGEALNALWADSWEHVGAQDWETILARSLGLVCAMDDERFVGFVNVVWDGGMHAFLLDTACAAPRRAGIEQLTHAERQEQFELKTQDIQRQVADIEPRRRAEQPPQEPTRVHVDATSSPAAAWRTIATSGHLPDAGAGPPHKRFHLPR